MTVSEYYSSTNTHPIRFFERFFESSKFMDQLRVKFFPDPNDPDNYWSDKIVLDINREEESFTYQYEKVIAYDVIEDYPGYATTFPSDTKWMEAKKIFSNEVEKVLYREICFSKQLINDSINELESEKYIKKKIKIWIGELLQFNTVATQDFAFLRYPSCSLAIKTLIRYLYKSFSVFCPKVTEEIISLNSDSSEPLRHFEKKKVLKQSFFKALGELKYETNTGKKEEFILEDMTGFSTKIWSMFNEKLVLPKMNFLWPTNAVAYLLHNIGPYCTDDYRIDRVLGSDNITFKGKRITRNRFDTAKNRFGKQRRQTILKTEIDNLLSTHITTINN